MSNRTDITTADGTVIGYLRPVFGGECVRAVVTATRRADGLDRLFDAEDIDRAIAWALAIAAV